MASKQGAKIGKTYLGVSNEIKVNNYRLISQDIQTWRRAIESAKSVTNPNRKLLYQLFDNILLDGHLQSVMEKRTMAITNQKIQWQSKGNKEQTNDFINEYVLNTPWFYNYNDLAMQHISFGHQLVELIPENGYISKALEVPRENVFPEKNLVLYDPNNRTAGIDYLQDPTYSPYLIEIGSKTNLGKLIIAAQYVIYKRGGFGDWAQFAELFGMPFRVGKYNPYDDSTRRLLDEALQQMGGAGHVIVPEGTNLEFHDNNQAGKSEVFSELINVCNAEISKLYLGQTMTTENGSSHSQSETHKNVEEEINLKDMILMEYHLNWELKDKLIAFGYPLADGKFIFPETSKIPKDKRIAIDVQLAQQIVIPDDYWYKTYGIPKPQGVEGKKELIKVNTTAEPKNITTPTMVSKFSIVNEIKQLYKHDCQNRCAELPKMEFSNDDLWDEVMKKVHKGEIVSGQISTDLYLWLAKELMKGVTKGFGGELSDFYINEPSRVMLAKLENNVHIFSAFKTYHELRDVTNLLVDENGKIRPLADFKKLALNVHDQYNKKWLATEYNQAIASSQMASKWVDIEANADVMPYLKYSTAGDDRVRASHKAMDGIIRPINDPFWDKYYPPNDWACRCDVVQVRKGTPTDLRSTTLPDLKQEFNLNSAKKQVIFPKNHPYFKVQKEHMDNAKENFGITLPNE